MLIYGKIFLDSVGVEGDRADAAASIHHIPMVGNVAMYWPETERERGGVGSASAVAWRSVARRGESYAGGDGRDETSAR